MGGHHRIGLYLGLFLCILGSFLKFKVQNGDIFRGIFFVVLEIPDFFFLGGGGGGGGLNGKCWA